MLLSDKKPVFPPKKGIFVYFLCFSFFLPQPFLAFPFFCFSFSVSLLLLFFSFFLPCLSFFCFILVPSFSLFLIFLSSLLLFSEKNNMQFLNCNLFFHQYFLFFLWFPVLFFSFKSLFLIFAFFLVFSYVFCLTSMFWVSKTQVKKHQFLVNRGVATKRFFFNNLCFEKCEKLSFSFWPFFVQILVDVQKTL